MTITHAHDIQFKFQTRYHWHQPGNTTARFTTEAIAYLAHEKQRRTMQNLGFRRNPPALGSFDEPTVEQWS